MLFARQLETGTRCNAYTAILSLGSAYLKLSSFTKYLSSQVTPVGRLCLRRFSIDSVLAQIGSLLPDRGLAIIRVINLPLQALLHGVFPFAKTEWQQGVRGYWFF